jgi:hypothetical protein
MAPATAARVQVLVQADMDWLYVLQAAGRHGIVPLLYLHLRTICPDRVPPPVLRQLQMAFQSNAIHNLVVTRELVRLLRLLQAQSIPVIPLKGPLLSVSLYGDLALRQFNDLDVLVPEGDMPTARGLLISQGYQPESPLLPAQEVARLHRLLYHYRFVHEQIAITLELHWGLEAPYLAFPPAVARVWERPETVSLAGTTIHSLPPVELLVFLCAHGAKHYWSRLGWICDIAEFVRVHQDMDWSALTAPALRLRHHRLLALGLSLASELLGAAVPKQVLQDLRSDAVVPALVTKIRRRLDGASDIPSGTLARRRMLLQHAIDEHYFHFQVQEGRRDKVRFCLRSALELTMVYWTLRPLPSCLHGLYVLLGRVQQPRPWASLLPLIAVVSCSYYALLPMVKFLQRQSWRLRQLPRRGSGEGV